MSLLISLLILLIVVIVVIYIIDMLGLPAPIPMIAKLIVGLVVLIYILQAFVPSLGSGIRLGSAKHSSSYTQTIV